ncbi:MAG: Sua5/YciO/YrdC/YwlC family protein, partial [Gammaproteobacteria bacterium]
VLIPAQNVVNLMLKQEVVDAIKEGKIVAIKSVGGYQLICDAHNENAIIRLRKNKERSHKPFIIMVLNTQSASQYVALTEEAKNSLESQQRPIVILPKIENNLPTQIAPHLNTLGVMLPYTPIHYLIFERLIELKKDLHWLNNANPSALIVTSGNNYGNPIITDDELAEKNLTDIADLIVNYNRDIVSHVDDSVVNLANNKTFFIRRARSYALQAIELPYEIPATIALGGHLKSTICITRNNEAFVSQHIADLTNVDSINVYHKTLNQILKLLNIKPACVAHDTHPNFYTSRIAPQFKLPIFAIQHHHAHLASMAAQTKLTKPALGLALDGFGLGERQESWGGELMHYQKTSYSRLGSLKPVLLPGGEQVVKQPWRMAVSILYELNKKAELHKRFSYYPSLFQLVKLLDEKVYMPMTTSCARLFDAISALLGICEFSTYEGQAAMMLESKVTTPTINEHGWSISDNQLNLLPLIDTILTCNQQDGANVFHGTLAAALIDWVVTNIVKFDTTNVILAGGCFLNRVLLELMINGLKKHNLTPIFPEDAIPSDAGLSLGQAWVAGNRMIDRILR